MKKYFLKTSILLSAILVLTLGVGWTKSFAQETIIGPGPEPEIGTMQIISIPGNGGDAAYITSTDSTDSEVGLIRITLIENTTGTASGIIEVPSGDYIIGLPNPESIISTVCSNCNSDGNPIIVSNETTTLVFYTELPPTPSSTPLPQKPCGGSLASIGGGCFFEPDVCAQDEICPKPDPGKCDAICIKRPIPGQAGELNLEPEVVEPESTPIGQPGTPSQRSCVTYDKDDKCGPGKCSLGLTCKSSMGCDFKCVGPCHDLQELHSKCLNAGASNCSVIEKELNKCLDKNNKASELIASEPAPTASLEITKIDTQCTKEKGTCSTEDGCALKGGIGEGYNVKGCSGENNVCCKIPTKSALTASPETKEKPNQGILESIRQTLMAPFKAFFGLFFKTAPATAPAPAPAPAPSDSESNEIVTYCQSLDGLQDSYYLDDQGPCPDEGVSFRGTPKPKPIVELKRDFCSPRGECSTLADSTKCPIGIENLGFNLKDCKGRACCELTHCVRSGGKCEPLTTCTYGNVDEDPPITNLGCKPGIKCCKINNDDIKDCTTKIRDGGLGGVCTESILPGPTAGCIPPDRSVPALGCGEYETCCVP